VTLKIRIISHLICLILLISAFFLGYKQDLLFADNSVDQSNSQEEINSPEEEPSAEPVDEDLSLNDNSAESSNPQGTALQGALSDIADQSTAMEPRPNNLSQVLPPMPQAGQIDGPQVPDDEVQDMDDDTDLNDGVEDVNPDEFVDDQGETVDEVTPDDTVSDDVSKE
jgi:hypothetical protein